MSVTCIDQLASGLDPHEQCGLACVLSILSDHGTPDSMLALDKYDIAHGDDPVDGTGGEVHVERLRDAGIACHVVQGDVGAMVRGGAAAGLNRWMVAIYSNSAGSPYSGPGNFGHWVLVYGFDGSTYSVMQPVGGKLQTYTRSQLEENAQGYSIQIDVPVGAGAAIPATGGDDLTPDQLLNLKRLPIWMERLHHENWPPGQVDIDSFATHIGDDLNFEPVITALHQTFETNHQPSTEELLAAVKAKVGA